MKFSLFRRSSESASQGETSAAGDPAPLSPALPEALDLTVMLNVEGQFPFPVRLHDMNIQGAEIVVPFHLAPLGGEGEMVALDVSHQRDNWNVKALGRITRVSKVSDADVLIEIQFAHLGDLYAQLDDALGRYFNRRSAARVKPEGEASVWVKISYGPHRMRGLAQDISRTGLGVSLPVAQAVAVRGNELVQLTIDVPGIDPDFEGPGIIKHCHRAGAETILGIEFDLLAKSSLKARRTEFLDYVERRREAMEAWQRQLSRPG